MVNKKIFKFDNIEPWYWTVLFFIPLFVFVFPANSYAMTENEIDFIINDYLQNSNEQNINGSLYNMLSGMNNFGSFIYNNISSADLDFISNSDYVVITGDTYYNNWLQFVFIYGEPYLYMVSSGADMNARKNLITNESYYMKFVNFSITNGVYSLAVSSEIEMTVNSSNYNLWNSRPPNFNGFNYITNGYVYNLNLNQEYDWPRVFYTAEYIPPVVNSITLVSSSNHKFGFNDFNQCRVYITGDWDFHNLTISYNLKYYQH